ncbi:MAG: hypothetical protein CSA70_01660 [Rhodobacterales bacterium]|nr:MAG: hypothetical protein CSA70_01660 [Rhodobacterales bacterium]
MDCDTETALARKGRVASLVIAVTAVLWIAVQFFGPKLGMPGRFALLFDFAAIAAFIWALVVTLQIRRARRDNEG